MKLAYKVHDEKGEYVDSVYTDWFQLCAFLMGYKSKFRGGITIDFCMVVE